eukprot:359900-Pyramimonas_sp.AAC.1
MPRPKASRLVFTAALIISLVLVILGLVFSGARALALWRGFQAAPVDAETDIVLPLPQARSPQHSAPGAPRGVAQRRIGLVSALRFDDHERHKFFVRV